MRFGEFVFYKTDDLNLDEKIAILRDCKEISYSWWVDKLDCSVSFARQRYECNFEEILDKLKKDSHFVVINRGAWGDVRCEGTEHFEIAFRSMEVPIDYFLFIQVESNKMPPILEKYNLQVANG